MLLSYMILGTITVLAFDAAPGEPLKEFNYAAEILAVLWLWPLAICWLTYQYYSGGLD